MMDATLSRRTEMRPRWSWVVAAIGVVLAAVIVVGALTQARDPYPLTGVGGSMVTSPALIGQPTRTVVVFMQPRAGDRIELLGAEQIGFPPDTKPTLFLSRAIPQADGSWLTGEALEPLTGTVIETPIGSSPSPEYGVGIVAEMTPTTAGIYELSGIRLRFRINGGREQDREGTSVIWKVCAGDPVQANCQTPPEEGD